MRRLLVLLTLLSLLTNSVWATARPCAIRLPSTYHQLAPYTGQCAHGFANGQGTVRAEVRVGTDQFDGVIEAPFIDGMPEGEGTFTAHDAPLKFKGIFRQGQMWEGLIQTLGSTGTLYVGEMQQGVAGSPHRVANLENNVSPPPSASADPMRSGGERTVSPIVANLALAIVQGLGQRASQAIDTKYQDVQQRSQQKSQQEQDLEWRRQQQETQSRLYQQEKAQRLAGDAKWKADHDAENAALQRRDADKQAQEKAEWDRHQQQVAAQDADWRKQQQQTQAQLYQQERAQKIAEDAKWKAQQDAENAALQRRDADKQAQEKAAWEQERQRIAEQNAEWQKQQRAQQVPPTPIPAVTSSPPAIASESFSARPADSPKDATDIASIQQNGSIAQAGNYGRTPGGIVDLRTGQIVASAPQTTTTATGSGSTTGMNGSPTQTLYTTNTQSLSTTQLTDTQRAQLQQELADKQAELARLTAERDALQKSSGAPTSQTSQATSSSATHTTLSPDDAADIAAIQRNPSLAESGNYGRTPNGIVDLRTGQIVASAPQTTSTSSPQLTDTQRAQLQQELADKQAELARFMAERDALQKQNGAGATQSVVKSKTPIASNVTPARKPLTYQDVLTPSELAWFMSLPPDDPTGTRYISPSIIAQRKRNGTWDTYVAGTKSTLQSINQNDQTVVRIENRLEAGLTVTKNAGEVASDVLTYIPGEGAVVGVGEKIGLNFIEKKTGQTVIEKTASRGVDTAVSNGTNEAVANTGKTAVYSSVGNGGVTNYVGITDNLESRAAAHMGEKSISVSAIPGLKNISRDDARAVEQVLIEFHGLGNNGGSLLNKINSISKSNPTYAQALIRGRQLLKQVKYPGF